MTENEAVKVLENEKECVSRNVKGCDRDCGKCDLVMDDSIIINVYDRAIIALQEIQQYRAIGTVEKCQEAREKQKPMRLYTEEVPLINERIKQIQCRCPQCGVILGVEISDNPIIPKEIRYCFNCGQKLYRT